MYVGELKLDTTFKNPDGTDNDATPYARYLGMFCEVPHWKRNEATCRLIKDPFRDAIGLPPGKYGEFVIGTKKFDSSVSSKRPYKHHPSEFVPFAVNLDSEFKMTLNMVGSPRPSVLAKWTSYLLEKFIGPWGYNMNGYISWDDDVTTGYVHVLNNVLEHEIILHDVPETDEAEEE